jgi:Tfp pilus assembly protein PilF
LQALGGDPAGALASFDTALRLDPSYAPAKAARAELLTPRQ